MSRVIHMAPPNKRDLAKTQRNRENPRKEPFFSSVLFQEVNPKVVQKHVPTLHVSRVRHSFLTNRRDSGITKRKQAGPRKLPRVSPTQLQE